MTGDDRRRISTAAGSVRWWASLAVAVMLALSALSACSDGSDGVAVVGSDAAATRGEHVGTPRVTGPITGGERGLPFNPLPARLAEEYGYTEAEFFIAGEATAYESEGGWDEGGVWGASPTHAAPYQTRMLVRRPSDPEAFNGTVVVEWLNVTFGDLDPAFSAAYEELLRSGYVWVGVSAQQAGVEGGAGIPRPGLNEVISLKQWDPERYGNLDHPGDDYSYDIYSQAAQAILRPDGADPLDGLAAQQVIATGESQSAMFMVTYVNAVHPIADIYDGFLLFGRLGGAAPLTQDSADTLFGAPRIRTDLSDPVMQFQTETDLFDLGWTALTDFFDLGFHAARQPDTERIRTWEVAGTAHVDEHMLDYQNESIREWDESYNVDLTGCGMNDGPQSIVLRAAWAALTEWVGGGEPPAQAEPIEVEGGAIARDRHGNALGGVRAPAVDAPIATLSGEGVCILFGSMTPFDKATLGSLYPTHRDYVEAVRAATRTAVDAGFLLPIDGDSIIDQAQQAPIPE